ncbi:MAG: helicase-associated domain-containing protein [Chloroflexia bacterium]|nr:helicase-associated domain-containing protein [Chloroflexia bacterium]
MRNLLGRLHARTPADLDRIAGFWRVPLGSGDRHGRVGALYRVMIDPIAGRDVWAKLAPDEATMLRRLATGETREDALTLAEVAAEIGVPEEAARETALRLYRVGLLAREGDADALPVGEAPRLFPPRELSLLFRRILDEIDLGDRSGTPLKVLVEWLDDGEIDEAAERWGVTTLPGVRPRAQIGGRLLRQMADPERVAKVARDLGADARRVWDALQMRPGGAPLPLAAAVALVGEGEDAGTAARTRYALHQLERSLLVWHTYRPDGSRWLFVPAEVRDPRPPAPAPLPPLLPLLPIAVREPLARPPFGLAWDLLTVLRETQATAWPAEGDLPRPRLRAINGRLWNAGPDLPPPGYLAFIVSLAAAEQLVEEVGDPPELRPTATGGRWRRRSFAEQSERLRGRWLADPDWTEGEVRDEVEVWGVEWPRARRRLVELLADPALDLEAARWYALDPLAARIAAREPALLGRRFTAATARLAEAAGASGGADEARAAAIADVIAVELQTAFAWFGLVDLAEAPGEGRGLRVGAAGMSLAQGAPPAEPPPEGPPIVVGAEGRVVLRSPSPARVWALSAFADAESLRPEVRFRLSAASLRRALEAGVDASQVVSFLERHGETALPAALVTEMAGWQRTVRRVRLRRALVLSPDDPHDEAALVALAGEHGWETRPLPGGGLLLLTRPGDEETALAALRADGFSPVVGGRPGSAAAGKEAAR